MYVKSHMLKKENLTTVDLEESIESAINKITQGNFLSLPVISNGELKGILMKEAIYRYYYDEDITDKEDFLTFRKVKDIYNDKIETIEDSVRIENASYLLKELSIPFLTVIDSNGKFKGILTHNAIFNAFSELVGLNTGSRIVINMFDIPGQLARLTELLRRENANIINIAIVDAKILDIVRVILRVETDNLAELMIKIQREGFKIGEFNS